jgi:predicted component of type VI protein secretion system
VVHLVVGVALGHRRVDLGQRQHPLLGRHQRLGDQLRVRQLGLRVRVGQLDRLAAQVILEWIG